MALAGGAHLVAFFGFNTPAAQTAVISHGDELEIVQLEMPPLEEMEEPEVFDSDGPAEELDASSYVPMQADIPSFTTDAVFVQKMDLQSLLPKPDLDAAKVVSIPTHTGRTRLDPSKMKDLFNISDLDRIPEAIFQPPPVFPRALKSEVTQARVLVEFIVDANGKVPWAQVIESSYRGFEDAAILGVSRWQFRPGMKNGKKVNTRMRVPLLFRVVDGE